MHLKPKYYSYLHRVWAHVYLNILIHVFIILSAVLFFGRVNILFGLMFIIVPVTIVYIVSSMIINKYYLKLIVVHEHNRHIELEVVKYDLPPNVITIDFADLEVRVSQVQWSYVKWHKIQFFKNKKLVFQQREFKEWDKDTFDKIAAKVKELKSKKT